MKLICPICGQELVRIEKEYRCENRHSFDIARQGHVNLLTVQQKKSLHPGDTREQVLSRRAFLEAGFYAPIAQTLCQTALELADGATFAPVKRDKKLLAFGDSITQGYDALMPHRKYITRLADHLGMEEINKAIGGAVFHPAFAELKDDVTPSVITVAYGTNDWSGVNNEKLVANATAFYTILRQNYPNATIVMLTPVWRGDWQRERPAVAFREIPGFFEKIAKEIGNAHVVDCFDFIPHDPANYSPDVLHPNDAGFAHYAKGVIAALEKLDIHI